FFSSRRRHTRFSRDWSSDVCSSDLIDPHLSWYNEFRFYEVRIYAGDYDVSGVSILGVPFPSLGHSRFCSVAMTTGGPDTSDIYRSEERRVGKECKSGWSR